jgi:hypothetical protein
VEGRLICEKAHCALDKNFAGGQKTQNAGDATPTKKRSAGEKDETGIFAGADGDA